MAKKTTKKKKGNNKKTKKKSTKIQKKTSKKKTLNKRTRSRKKDKLETLRGMHDILPEENPYWEKIRRVVFDVADFYDFGYLKTPIVESAELFKRTLGDASDIVTKEMYEFKIKSGDKAVLRPEGTAPVMRAYIEHGWSSLPQPVKRFYWGPMFRYEKPQKGRYRQHHQFGFEMMGIDSALADAEVVQLAFSILQDLGLKNVMVKVNTLGDREDREKYIQDLKSHFKSGIKKMCKNCGERYKSNPLRILDCKEEICQERIKKAPQIVDHIGDSAKDHFKLFLEFLDESETPYILDPYLVRGLDYYNRTVFEVFVTSGKKEEEDIKNKNAILAGGRYDGLAEILGGKNVPGVGFAAGIERIVKEMRRAKSRVGGSREPKVFLVQLGELAKKKGLSLMEELRKSKISVSESLGRHSIRSQMKIADKLGVKLALILGQKEALAEEIIIRDMKSGAQETVSMDKLMKEIKKRLKSKK